MRVVLCLLLGLAATGCGARKHFVDVTPKDQPAPQVQPQAQAQAKPAIEGRPSGPASLEAFIAEVKRKVADTKAPEKVRAAQAETSDPRLAAALAAAQVDPIPATYRAVAFEYSRLGVADKAHEYLDGAVVLDPNDGVTYDALARIWRDGGFADRALADAYRAVYYAPDSAAARNTLGTVFQAMGRHADARREFQRAIDRDPSAAYAINNLCYALILDGEARKAQAVCQRAVALDPKMSAARNNLALAFAAVGNLDGARAAFSSTGDKAAAQYNIGIVHLATRRYSDAVSAFAAAQQLRPDWRQATARARQAEKLAHPGAEE